MSKPHIDVRGPVPIYIDGMKVISLDGFNRNVTIEEVRNFLLINEKKK